MIKFEIRYKVKSSDNMNHWRYEQIVSSKELLKRLDQLTEQGIDLESEDDIKITKYEV